MKRLVVFSLGMAVMVGFSAREAFAIKFFHDTFATYYVEKSDNEDFKKAATEAKCNLCHIEGESKKKRNEYGEALHEYLHKGDFPAKRLKAEPEKCREEVEAAFKKAEELKDKAGKTFGEKIKAGVLPGA